MSSARQEYRFDFTLRFAFARPKRIGNIGARLGDDVRVTTPVPGRYELTVRRRAPTAVEAIARAIGDVRRACPGIRLVEVGPDLVGLADIAPWAGCTRQNMRLRALRDFGFPSAVYPGKPQLYHLADLLHWVRKRRGGRPGWPLMEVAEAARQINLAQQLRVLPRGRIDVKVRRALGMP